VRARRILNFRVYCDHVINGSGESVCTSQPKSITGSAGTSSVYGQFVSHFVPGTGSGGTVSPLADHANLE